MPSFNTPLYNAQIGTAGQTPAVSYPLAEYVAGKVRYAIVPYSLAGTEATNDLLYLVKLKIGAVVIPSLSRIVCEDPGTALTLDIGFLSNPDALCDGAALTTAHDVSFTLAPSVTATAAQYVPVPIASSADSVIYATIVLATVPTAGAKLLFLIAYVDE